MPLPVDEITKLIKKSIPDATIEIKDLMGDNMNEQDIEKLSIRKIRIIDTGLFHIKRESFITIEAEVMWIIQESKSICFIKRRYQ